jgi:polyphosphate kinase 2 PPK2
MLDLEHYLSKKCGFDLKKVLVKPGQSVSLAKEFDTSTPWAPWYVVPADHKWFTRLCVSQIIVATLKALALKHPKATKEQLDELDKAKQELLKED